MQHFLGSILSQVLMYFQQTGNGVRVFQSIAPAVWHWHGVSLALDAGGSTGASQSTFSCVRPWPTGPFRGVSTRGDFWCQVQC